MYNHIGSSTTCTVHVCWIIHYMYMYMYVRSSTTCTCTCMFIHYMYMYMYVRSSTICTCTCMLDHPLHVHVHVCWIIHYMYMYMYMYMYVRSSTTCTCMYWRKLHVHMYIKRYKFTCTHVHQKIQIGVTHVGTHLYFFLVPETQFYTYSYLVFFHISFFTLWSSPSTSNTE